MIPLLGAVAALSAAALTGCSAGQITQTSTQVATVNGSSTAKLVLAVANQGLAEDTLLDVEGEFFASATIPSDEEPATGEAAAGVEAEVPAQGVLQFGTSEFPTIELSDLSEELSVAQVVSLTFVFEQAGEVTVDVPVANPIREINREEGFDFHTEEAEQG
jgi:copper(I)-binding protein